MDFLSVHLPIADLEFSVVVLLAVGFCVGTLSGFFGVGGGWVITPLLNIFGFSMPLAIGTSLVQTFGQSIIATAKHSRMGNVDWKLGLLSILGSIAGVEVGKQAIFFLEEMGLAGVVIRWVYIVFLSGLGTYVMRDYFATRRAERMHAASGPAGSSAPKSSSPAAVKFRGLTLGPFVSLPTSGIQSISFWSLFIIFFAAGFLSGFMGVGGGFILLPALIYLVGVPTTAAIGTSLLGVTFMAGYGSFIYSLSGQTDLIAAAFMLIGASFGTQFGALATRFIHGYGIRLLFSIMLLLAGVSVALKQVYSIIGHRILGSLAGIVVLGAAGAMALLIIMRLLIGIRKSREEQGYA